MAVSVYNPDGITVEVIGNPPPNGGNTSTPVQAWQARPLPNVPGDTVLRCSASYFRSDGYGGGRKHATMLHCPLDGRMYIFGGDCSGYASAADKAAGAASDDFRNDEWSYDAAIDKWQMEKGWDCGDGKIQPWRPDWGAFAYDTKRNVVWFIPGGSNGAWGGGAAAPFYVTGKSGLQFSYNKAQLLPDTTIVPAGSLTLTDNATNYVEYNPTTHTVSSNTSGFTGGSVIALYQVPVAGGVIGPQIDMRPYWMQYGDTVNDKIDFRHYAHPLHLIYRDMATGLWTDPGLAPVGSGNMLPNSPTSGGNPAPAEGRIACMIYDQGGDQLVFFAAGSGLTTAVVHFSITQNTWTRIKAGVPGTNLSQARYWFNEADRKIYAVEPCGSSAPNLLTMVAWTYHVDTHVFSVPVAVPDCQSGPALWTVGGTTAGTMVGGMQSMTTAMGDPGNGIIWFPEVTNPFLCPYGYENDGAVLKIHAWHYKETPWRFETIIPPFDAANHPHGIITGFDPVNRLLLTYGQNSGNPANPVNYTKFMYAWEPSGFTQ